VWRSLAASAVLAVPVALTLGSTVRKDVDAIRETVAQTKDVPAAALEAIRKGAAGGKIKQIAKDEIRAELKDAKIIKLDSPKYRYEADLVKGNQVAEIQVSPEGQVIEAPKWKARGAKEN